MLILGGIIAADVPADKTLPKVNPGIAHLEALLAALATRLHLADLLYVMTDCLFVRHESPPQLPLCTFVSFAVDEVQMLKPQRTRRYAKEFILKTTNFA
jgi:hypothetical protein